MGRDDLRGAETSVEEIDIWRSAEILRKQHGADASIMAAMRADQLLDQGDAAGSSTMRRVVAAINELERTTPGAGERVN